ncbi:MAG TPA: hypothetical protein VF860_07230 [Candidatus Acidoferrales bacterium]|jgi:hypothetical protein
MQTWKYHVEEIFVGVGTEGVEEQLNELGSGGWEIVSVLPQPGTNPEGKFYVLFKQSVA